MEEAEGQTFCLFCYIPYRRRGVGEEVTRAMLLPHPSQPAETGTPRKRQTLVRLTTNQRQLIFVGEAVLTCPG